MYRKSSLFLVLVILLVAGCRRPLEDGAADDNSAALTTATSVAEHSPDIIETLVEDASATPKVSTMTPEAATATATATAMAAITGQLEVSVEPDLDEVKHRTEDPLTFHFNQPMDPDSARRPLLISPSNSGEIAWNEDNTSLTYSPETPFRAGRYYNISLHPDLRSAGGVQFATIPRWHMYTWEAPRVVTREPAGLQLSALSPTIHVTFDLPMDEDSVAGAFEVSPDVAYLLEWQDNTLAISFDAPLEIGERYSFAIGTDARDVDGAPLENSYRWWYELPDLLADVNWSAVADASDESGGRLLVRFNYPLDWGRVGDALTLEPVTQGEWSWDEETLTATFEPESRLEADSEYAVGFPDALILADGAVLPGPAPASFHTPPPILHAGPTGTNNDPGMSITVAFDRPMDEAATEAAFSIEPAVEGDFSWEETTLSFHPQEGFLADYIDYEVSIGTDAKAADGSALLDEPYVWSFRTGELQSSVDFGWGPNAQVLDTDGRRAVHFRTEHKTALPVRFELYRLTREQLLDRYASGFRGGSGFQDGVPFVSTEDTELVNSWEMLTARSPEWYLTQETIVPENVPPGFYVLDMVTNHREDQLILILSSNTITVKQAEGQLLTWVTNINGDPVPKATVLVYARNGDLLDSGVTDLDGIFEAQVPHDAAAGGTDVAPLMVMAGLGDDITMTGLTPEWSSGGYWGWWQSAPVAQEHAVYIFTERPIYKPGQELFYKVAVRADDDAALSLPPAGTSVAVRIRDARDNVVITFDHTTSAAGSLDGSFQLAEGAMLGDYAVEVVVDGESFRQLFKVEDYRKPDFEVLVSTDREQAVDGEDIVVEVEALYLFGEPLAGAPITLNQLQTRSFYDYYADTVGTEWLESDSPALTALTDDRGRAVFTVTAESEVPEHYYYYDWGNSNEPTSWAFEASVDDGSRQPVSGYATVNVYNAGEVVHLDLGGYLHSPDEPYRVKGTLSAYSGEPVAGRELTLELRRWNRGTYEYDLVFQTVSMTTSDDGLAETLLTVSEPGYYQTRLSGRDPQGHEYYDISGLYVFSESRTSWYGGTGQGELSIAADRDSYAPGDIATLLIQSDLSGPALLTFERGRTRREMFITLEAPVTRVEIPILPEDVPNIYVTVNIWREQDTEIGEQHWSSIPDSRLDKASVNLSVPATEQQLEVVIVPDQTTYAPRDEATFVVGVTDQGGQPVSGAELTLALVDEAIFLLSDPLTVPIYEAYYYERDNIVRTYDALRPTREMGGGGMGGGGDGPAPGNPRTDFPDTAAWFPTLTSDANGEVEVTITLPDSLTTWRLTAFAITPDTAVGETTAEFVTQQEIILRPLMPRSLVEFDTLQLSALVHNYSDVTQTVTVTLTGGETILEFVSAPQTLSLAPGEVQVVGWQAEAIAAGDATLLFTAEGDDARDAIELPIQINPLAVRQVETDAGQFQDSYETTITLPPDALDTSEVEIRLSRSIASSLLTGLEYLTGFPYGCVEQTMSKALPNAVVGRALFQLGVSDPTMEADLPPRINAGVQRLYGYQHGDGGWGWWYDDETDDYQTAWVIFGLATTAQAGYEIDPQVIERGVEYLSSRLGSLDPRTRAFALYAMATAGLPDQAATLELAEEADALDPFSQAALALALFEAGEVEGAERLLDTLLAGVVHEDESAYWKVGIEDGSYHRKTMASSTRSTALALSALSRIRPDAELEEAIVRWLMDRRGHHGWGTTNETAFAIIGLTDHLLAKQAIAGDSASAYAIRLNGVLLAEGALGPGIPSATLLVPVMELVSGDNILRLEQNGPVPLYYAINSQFLLAREAIAADGRITVDRRYLDPQTNLELESIKPGQLVEVEVRVTLPEAASYMLVEDRLPAGLEALNEGLNTTSHRELAYGEPARYWNSLGYNQKEIFGDRVTFFITEMSRGRHTFTYLARATQNGRFTALPAEAYAMYDLALWGRSPSDYLVIQETANACLCRPLTLESS